MFVFLIFKESVEFGGTTQREELSKLGAWQNYNPKNLVRYGTFLSKMRSH